MIFIMFVFNNHFSTLGTAYYRDIPLPNFCKNPTLVHFNKPLATIIPCDIESYTNQDIAYYLSGAKIIKGSQPLAMVYSGHQFGVWAGQLGDGRAILLGQVQGRDKIQSKDKKSAYKNLWDIQLKGSGLTPYSRMGDGRAVMRSTIREYLCSEAMAGLHIPTSRALAITATHESVIREQIEPGAILTRCAHSHIRFGHFEHFFHHRLHHLIKPLADYVIETYYQHPLSYQDWLADICQKTAFLIAQWQAVGFAHGVMNTDNMSILGLTIDYGPFGFQDAFDVGFICNHSDTTGRYAFDQQPSIALWNLYALAYALQDLIPYEESQEILKNFQDDFSTYFRQLMARKLGIKTSKENDIQIWQELMILMQKHHADYTITFRLLAKQKDILSDDFKKLFSYDAAIDSWYQNYQQRMQHEPPHAYKRMHKINPKYILRNWVAEYAIREIEDKQNYHILDDMLTILHQPYHEHKTLEFFASPPPKTMKNIAVSCSS